MSRKFAMSVFFGLIASHVMAQPPTHIHSHPFIPDEAALNRLNLTLGWRTFVATDGYRDSLQTVHVLRDQILVQTQSSTISALNPEDGSTQWRVRFGIPYRSTFSLDANADSVFAYNGLHLFGFDRHTGAALWQMTPANAPIARPASDNAQVYLALAGGRMDVFELRRVAEPANVSAVQGTPAGVPRTATETDSPPEAGGKPLPEEGISAAAVGAQYSRMPPRFSWTALTGSRLEMPAIPGQNSVALTDVEGVVAGTRKDGPVFLYRSRFDAPVAKLPVRYADSAYLATADASLIAVSLADGNVIWRFTAAAPIRYQPAVTDEDVYVTADDVGLYRINRLTGEEVWRFRMGERFLSANHDTTYVLDRNGRLVVLDRLRGTPLSSMDVRDYVVPIVNEVTDRIYLAAHDGTFVCLHDRALARPVPARAKEVQATPVTHPARRESTERPEEPAADR